jgi:glycosyltransferase involved in cell wall biosynthesis
MSERPPLVSILMPTLNASQYVEDSLKSIACQGIERLEVVISDGGSSDDTLEKVQSFAMESGLHVRILPGSDSGQSDGLNRALVASEGEIIGWLNASDEYCAGSLKTLVELLLQDERLLLVYGHHESIDEEGHQISWTPALPPWAWVHRHESFVMNAQSMLWRPELHRRAGRFDVCLDFTMDYDLMLRFLDVVGRGEAKRCDITVGRFRRHEGQKTSPETVIDVVALEHQWIENKLTKRSARSTAFLLPFWLAGRIVRLLSVLQFEGLVGVRRVLESGPRITPVRRS